MDVGKPRANSVGRYGKLSGHESPVAQASWEEAEPEQLWRVIERVTNAGDYIAFSRTSDGGALVITLIHERERTIVYARGAEEIAEKLASVLASVEIDS